MDSRLMRFKDYFAGRSVFLTGGTGFIGMALIEGLLSSSPDLQRVYVLVREKRGFSPEERLARLLTSEIFAHLPAEVKAKVVPVVGEITAKDLGLSPNILAEIRECVSVIYHNAGLIKFNRTLCETVQMNVLTTLRCIELAKSLNHLSAFVYSSTVLANSNVSGRLREEVYKTMRSPREMIELALETPSSLDRVAEIREDFIERHHNTYSYSKQLAENLILEEMSGLPAGIVRPALVYGFYKHEIAGWMGNSRSGHCSQIKGFIKGVARCVYGKPETNSLAVPCDHVVNSTLALTVAIGSRSTVPILPEVIHVSNNREVSPLTVQETVDIMNEEVWKNPCDSYVLLPRCKIRNGLRADFYLLVSYILALLLYFPERIFKWTPEWMRGTRMVEIQYNARKYFEEIDTCVDDLDIDNYVQLSNSLHPEDHERWSHNPADVDFRKLFASTISWLRQYFFKDSNRVTWMHRVVQRCFQIWEFFLYIFVFVSTTVVNFYILQSWIIASVIGFLYVSFALWV